MIVDLLIYGAAVHALGSSALRAEQKCAVRRYFRWLATPLRQRARYDREIAAARARGWTLTAARIEAERAGWLATLDATGND